MFHFEKFMQQQNHSINFDRYVKQLNKYWNIDTRLNLITIFRLI